ncbi:MAG: YqcC family protein [Cellvibrionaceae bacterium]|nr:YqcC family protein [Cellvibrionaceae bacterium]
MTDRHIAVAEILLDIECELRRSRLWQSEMPSDEALASEQPFALDTLDFHQWLQFILLPRLHHLVDQRLPLPAACGISPVAEEVYKQRLEVMKPLLLQLQRLDRVFQ